MPWQEAMRELKRVQIGEIEVEGQRNENRSKGAKEALAAYKAAGVREGKQLRLIEEK